MKLNIGEDCGNSPKKSYLRDFLIAFAEADTRKILDMLADDMEWVMVGRQTLTGKQEIEQELKSMEWGLRPRS